MLGVCQAAVGFPIVSVCQAGGVGQGKKTPLSALVGVVMVVEMGGGLGFGQCVLAMLILVNSPL